MLKDRVLYLTILKRKSLSLPLKVDTNQFVICLVLPECPSVKICCISPLDSEANRDGAIGILSTLMYTEFDCVALLAML